MGFIKAIAIELLISLLWGVIRNTKITLDPPSLYTRLLWLGILIDAAGVHLEITEWQP